MNLRLRGVVYDVGVSPFPGRSSRPVFEAERCAEEMSVIAGELGCTAVRIVGRDLDRLEIAAKEALRQGLEVWLSPIQHNATAKELLAFLHQVAVVSERLRTHGSVVLMIGWELTLFMRGLVMGKELFDRAKTFQKIRRLLVSTVRYGPFNSRLNSFLTKALAVVQKDFTGPVAYAAGMWEQPDWSKFDYVTVDCYRDASNRERFPELIRGYKSHGKPVVASEFGCCTFVGARDKGSMGWAIVDREADPPQIKGDYVRSEQEQATELSEVLDLLETENFDGAFAYVFANYSYPHDEDPKFDLDMAAYGVIACLEDGSWRRKEGFTTLAQRYKR